MAEQEYEIRNKHMLIVAAVLAVIAVLLVLWNESRVRHENDEDMIDIVVAAKDIKPDKKLEPSDLRIDQMARRMAPADMLDDVAKGADLPGLPDFQTTQEIKANQVIRFTYLRGGKGGPAAQLLPREGYRIVGVQIDRGNCPPDLRPGMWVDIRSPVVTGKTGTPDTIAVMKRVLVKTINGGGNPSAAVRNIDLVGVEVREDDAAKLSALQEVVRAKMILYTRNADEPLSDRERSEFNDAVFKEPNLVRRSL